MTRGELPKALARCHPSSAAGGRRYLCRELGIRPVTLYRYVGPQGELREQVKQHLAAIRMLGDWLVVSQVLPVNPAAAVRGPKHVVTKGATPVLSPAEARKLLESIGTDTLAGLRALLSVMLYSFARVSAVLGMRRQDYFGQRPPPSMPTSRRAGSTSRRRRSSRPWTRRAGG